MAHSSTTMFAKISIVLPLLLATATAFSPSQIIKSPSVVGGDCGVALKNKERVGRNIVGPVMGGKERELRNRISSITNTRKITEAMRLVAAAKVRRAQQAVLATRPFSETLQKVFGGLIRRIGNEPLDLPLLEQREVKKVTLVTMSGDRGLCGSYNIYVIKKTENRIAELEAQGIEVELVTIGKKCSNYFRKRATPVAKAIDMGQKPTAEDANEIADYILAAFLGGETDSVEMLYTKFVSLIASTPSVRTMVPLSPRGIETEGDEIFQLTSKDGQFSVDRESVDAAEPAVFPKDVIFEQDPIQILDAILPLYINGQILRMLQESVASELAARMQAMQSASDNAKNLKTDLSREYNRARQASVTQEILEIVSGANAAAESG